VPESWIRNGGGLLRVVWSAIALLSAMLLIGMVGRLARYYFGRKLIQGVDGVLMRVPLLNRVYTALKQIHEAFTSGKTASFKQVVVVEFPRPGLYSIGFVTGADNAEVQVKTRKRLLGVFVPTPPLTSGSIVLVPEADVFKLDMSVADGLKFIMSLGSVSPAYRSPDRELAAGAADDSTGSGHGANDQVDWTFVTPAPSLGLAVASPPSPHRYEYISAEPPADS